MMYRAFAAARDPAAGSIRGHATPRPPGNISYVADNVLEWLRPARYPCRRSAAFACATPAAAAATLADPARAWVYPVALPDGQEVAHLRAHPDAKFHPDVVGIPAAVRRYIQARHRAWFGLPAAQRGALSALFLPCATAAEVEAVLGTGAIQPLGDQLRAAVMFWGDTDMVAWEAVGPHLGGELFFSIPLEGYRLGFPAAAGA